MRSFPLVGDRSFHFFVSFLSQEEQASFFVTDLSVFAFSCVVMLEAYAWCCALFTCEAALNCGLQFAFSCYYGCTKM